MTETQEQYNQSIELEAHGIKQDSLAAKLSSLKVKRGRKPGTKFPNGYKKKEKSV